MKLDESNVADTESATAFRSLAAADRKAIAVKNIARYLETGLICAAADIPERLAALAEWDVDEVSCLVDFGYDYASIMQSLDDLLTVLA
jgi:hypothetical protein